MSGAVDPVARLSRALRDGDGGLSRERPAQGTRAAAVLILIGPGPDVTLVERSRTLRAHAGQMAFPGGGIDAGESPTDAALRETWEEIGLPPEQITVVGTLPPAHVAASGFDVTAVVATWAGTYPIAAVDVAEVASVQRFALADLADPERRATAAFGTYRGPAFLMGEFVIWGFTAHLLDHVLRLGGWERPWDGAREVEVPARFLRGDASRA